MLPSSIVHAARPVRQHEHASFVDDSPSTVIALKVNGTLRSVRATASAARPRHPSSGSQHRRHARLDHARALRHAADLEGAGRRFNPHRLFLWERIGRHDRAGGAAPVGGQRSSRCGIPARILSIFKLTPMTPVERPARDARCRQRRRRQPCGRLDRRRSCPAGRCTRSRNRCW